MIPDVRQGLGIDQMAELLRRPLVATLATYRKDGSVLLSPVWHEWRDDGFTIVATPEDVKVRHLERDARAGLVVYEHQPPYAGIEFQGTARLMRDVGPETLLRVATRYLGSDGAEAWIGDDDDPSILIRLEGGRLRIWDFADEYPTDG